MNTLSKKILALLLASVMLIGAPVYLVNASETQLSNYLSQIGVQSSGGVSPFKIDGEDDTQVGSDEDDAQAGGDESDAAEQVGNDATDTTTQGDEGDATDTAIQGDEVYRGNEGDRGDEDGGRDEEAGGVEGGAQIDEESTQENDEGSAQTDSDTADATEQVDGDATDAAEQADGDEEAADANALPDGFIDESSLFLDELLGKLEAQVEPQGSIAAAPVTAEVAFVIDSTGSMAPYIANIKSNIALLSKSLGDLGVTLKLAIVEYKDITFDGIYSTVVHMTNNSVWLTPNEFISTLNRVYVYGGGDEPETPIDALGYLVDGRSTPWGKDTPKYAFLLTDASYKTNNRHGYATLTAVADRLAQLKINTSVITTLSLQSLYSPLTAKTGGAGININSANLTGDLLKQIAASLAVNPAPTPTPTPMPTAPPNPAPTPAAKKAIYIIPGYLASELYDSTSASAYRLWPDIHFIPIIDWMQREHPQLINRNADGSGEVAFASGKDILPNGKDDYGAMDVYKKLVDTLKTSFGKPYGGNYDVKFFPYNFLGDINHVVIKLEDDAKSYDKITIVTHSTGGLVAAAYVAKSRINQLKIEKLVMIAPPLYGTYSALFPLERGDSGKGFNLLDLILNANWVKQITRNSPTTYQLLPSREYFETTQALDIKTKDALLPWNQAWIYNANWNEFYRSLAGSANINDNLLSSAVNPRSHKNFRERSVAGSYASITDNLRLVNTTVIGTTSGKSTPKTAQYDVSKGYANTRLMDIIYDRNGDGTVYGTSLGKPGLLHTLSYSGLFAPDHTGLISDDGTLRNVVNLIRSAAGAASAAVSGAVSGDTSVGGAFDWNGEDGGADVGAYVWTGADDGAVEWAGGSTAGASYGGAAGGGIAASMAGLVKLRVECDSEIAVRIFDGGGDIVAYCDSEVAKGFDGENLICGRYGDEDETLTSIYLPNASGRIGFYNGLNPDEGAELTVKIYLLDADGYYNACGTYACEIDAVAGAEVLALNVADCVTAQNMEKLADESDYPDLEISSETYDTAWDFDLSGLKLQNHDTILLEKIGETATIQIWGNVNPDDLIWSSSDESVITVDAGGAIEAVGYGYAMISAYTEDGSGKVKSIKAKVALYPSSVNFDDISIVVGERAVIQPIFDSDSVTETEIIYTFDAEALKYENGAFVGLKPSVTEVYGYTVNNLMNTFLLTVTDEVITIKSISIKAAPFKTTYIQGEALDITGLEVSALYSDGNTGALTGFAVSPADGTALDETGVIDVLVEFDGFTDRFSIVVYAVDPNPEDKNPDPDDKDGNQDDKSGEPDDEQPADGNDAKNLAKRRIVSGDGAGARSIEPMPPSASASKTDVSQYPRQTGSPKLKSTNGGKLSAGEKSPAAGAILRDSITSRLMGSEWINPYADVIETDWYYDAVSYASKYGIMKGTGESIFSPDEKVSRAMLAVILYRLIDEPQVDGAPLFKDAPDGNWHSDAISWAGKSGVILGYYDGRFGVDDEVTREQILTILYRFTQFIGVETDDSADLARFSDSGRISDWALPAVRWAIGAGLIEGRGGGMMIAPAETATRAEIAAILYRYLS